MVVVYIYVALVFVTCHDLSFSGELRSLFSTSTVLRFLSISMKGSFEPPLPREDDEDLIVGPIYLISRELKMQFTKRRREENEGLWVKHSARVSLKASMKGYFGQTHF